MKDIIKSILKMILMVIVASIIGIVLMTLVYCIPRESIVKNILASEEELYILSDGDKYDTEDYSEMYDTKTNIIMLQEVVSPPLYSPFKDALLSPTSNYAMNFFGDWVSILMQHAQKDSYEDGDLATYPRYWHGYIIFLKPLFVFLNLKQIYMINTILQIILSIAVLYLFVKKQKAYTPAFILTLGTLNPMIIAKSFQLSSIYYAMLLTILCIFIFSDAKEKKKVFLYTFVLDGIFVAFFDFLTYPLVAFGVPVIVTIILSDQSLKDNIIDIVKNGCAFLWGYAGMWISKWVWASIFTEENVILDGILSVLHRIGSVEDSTSDSVFATEINPVVSIVKNAESYFSEHTIAMIIVFLIFIGIIIVKNNIKINYSQSISTVIPLALISLLPIAWFVVLNNHCTLHPHLEYREWSVMIFALAVVICHFTTLKREICKNI